MLNWGSSSRPNRESEKGRPVAGALRLSVQPHTLSTARHFVRSSFDVHTPITEIEDVSFVVLSPVWSRDRTGLPCIAEPAQWIMVGRPSVKHARPVVRDVVNNGIGKSHARIVNNIAHGTRAGNVLRGSNICRKGSRDDQDRLPYVADHHGYHLSGFRVLARTAPLQTTACRPSHGSWSGRSAESTCSGFFYKRQLCHLC